MVRGNGSISICIQFDNRAPATKKSKARSCTGLICARHPLIQCPLCARMLPSGIIWVKGCY